MRLHFQEPGELSIAGGDVAITERMLMASFWFPFLAIAQELVVQLGVVPSQIKPTDRGTCLLPSSYGGLSSRRECLSPSSLPYAMLVFVEMAPWSSLFARSRPSSTLPGDIPTIRNGRSRSSEFPTNGRGPNLHSFQRTKGCLGNGPA